MRALIVLLLASLPLTALHAADTRKAAAPQASQKAMPAGKLDRRNAGKPAPAVSFTTRDGKSQTLADYRGKPVLVNLWATWCRPCVAEMPALDIMAQRLAGRVTVLPLSQDLAGWRAVDGFFKPGRFKALKPVLDKPGDFASEIGATGLPVTILYDAQGREVWRVSGPLAWEKPETDRLLR